MQLLLSRSLTLASSKLNNFRVSGEFSFCWMIRFWNRISGLLDWSLSKLSRPRVSFESQQNFFKKLITFFQTVSELRSSFCRYKIESVTFWFGVFVLLILRTSKGLFFFLLTRQFFLFENFKRSFDFSVEFPVEKQLVSYEFALCSAGLVCWGIDLETKSSISCRK